MACCRSPKGKVLFFGRLSTVAYGRLKGGGDTAYSRMMPAPSVLKSLSRLPPARLLRDRASSMAPAAAARRNAVFTADAKLHSL